jgi:hypothetical protein
MESQKIDMLNLENRSIAPLSFQKSSAEDMDAVAVLYQLNLTHRQRFDYLSFKIFNHEGE